MNWSDRAPRRSALTWTYALVGGLVSVPLNAALYWQSGGGAEFPMSMVLVGGVLAGVLAERRSAAPAHAGIGAGLVGGLPAFGWILPALFDTAADFAAAWSSPAAGVVLAVLFGAIILLTSAATGLIGGALGSWLVKKVDRRRTRAVGN